MPTYSKNGKLMGRPPKARTPEPPKAPSTDLLRALKARYDAAGRGRRLAGWTPPSSGPNTAIAGLQTIRNRSRDSARNDWAGESSIQKWSSNLIGIGITPRFKRITNKTRKQALTDLWNDFVHQADADGVLNLYAMQTLVVRSWLDAGEVFARRRRRFDDEGFPVPMQVQLLEADMVPLLDSDSYQGLPAGNIIRSGIELNKRGRRVAYWFYKEHPGDRSMGSVIGPDDLVRVAASDVAHIYEPKRPGQLRGVSLLAPVLTRLRNVADYEDATLERQKIANLWVLFLKRTLPNFDPTDPANSDLTGLPTAVDTEGSPLLPLRPGLIQSLDDGEEVQFANPPEAGTNYSDYMRTSHLGTAAGAGLPYELMAGDIKEISDRTLRVLINDFRRFAEQRQWQIVIPMFCQRVIDWFAEAAVLIGAVSPDELNDVRRVEHAPHGWEYIHPVQDPQGKKLEVEAGFRSRSSVIGARGDDPDAVDEERQQDMQREKDLGLWVDPMGTPGAAADDNEDDDGIDNEEYSAPPNVAARRALQKAQLDAYKAIQERAARPERTNPNAAAELELLERSLAMLTEDRGERQ